MEKLTDRISTPEGKQEEDKCPELLWISPTAHSEDQYGQQNRACKASVQPARRAVGTISFISPTRQGQSQVCLEGEGGSESLPCHGRTKCLKVHKQDLFAATLTSVSCWYQLGKRHWESWKAFSKPAVSALPKPAVSAFPNCKAPETLSCMTWHTIQRFFLQPMKTDI